MLPAVHLPIRPSPAPVSLDETSSSDEAKQADALSSAEVSSSGPDFSAASTAHPATSSSDAGNVAFAPGGVSAANETPNTPQSSAVNQPASGAAAPYAQAPGMGQGQQVYSRQFPNSQPAAYQNQNQRIYPVTGSISDAGRQLSGPSESACARYISYVAYARNVSDRARRCLPHAAHAANGLYV